MDANWPVVFYVMAIICFVIAAFNLAPRVPWMLIGLALFAAGHVITDINVETGTTP